MEARTRLASFGLKSARALGEKCDWPAFCLAPVALVSRYVYLAWRDARQCKVWWSL